MFSRYSASAQLSVTGGKYIRPCFYTPLEKEKIRKKKERSWKAKQLMQTQERLEMLLYSIYNTNYERMLDGEVQKENHLWEVKERGGKLGTSGL